MQTHVQNTEYRDVPVVALIESPSNPRKRFDESSLNELAVSFRSQGVLAPAAGSCVNCPKRTGFNKLLFADVRKDSCTDPQCFRAKVDAHIATMETKPELVQISSAWNTREGAPLGRNHYVELQIKKAKANGNPFQKPCEKMADAIVMDGGNRKRTRNPRLTKARSERENDQSSGGGLLLPPYFSGN
jgi:hypothetical protein